jgi:xanthine dehydrogenase accessory factor
MNSLWQTATGLAESGEPFVLVTLVAQKGSSPQEPGAKAVITSSGLAAGTVGGGKIEARAIDRAREILHQLSPVRPQAPRLEIWNLQRDIGMTCGGEVTLLFECHPVRPWSVAIFGAGHVGQALVRVLSPLDCRITVADSRPEWLEKLPPNPKLRAKCHADPRALVAEIGAHGFYVVMTMGHATDVPVLAEIFRRFPEAPFVGVMGSDVKGEKIRRELLELGIPADAIERLRCPIGLSLGTNAPAEIALSVAAQLIQVRDSLLKI